MVKNAILGVILTLTAATSGIFAYNYSPTVRASVGGIINVTGILRGISAPTAGSDAATKAYVDAATASTPSGWTCTVRTSSFTCSAGTGGDCGFPIQSTSCVGGEKVVNGGCNGNNPNVTGFALSSYPSNQGWNCYYGNLRNGGSITTYANCCQ